VLADKVFDAPKVTAISKLLDALGVQADAAFRELDPALRQVLTVGRPVATE
jgi:hypothetical protein